MLTIRFYEELNFFLSKKKQDIRVDYDKTKTVKKIIEDLGVPHTEVDLILVNGSSVDFNYIPEDEDRISVYPVFESFNIRSVSRVRPKPLRKISFILDVHLGKLATALRMLGFDTLYSNSYEDNKIAGISKREKRIILTRDKELLKRKIITHGYYVRSKEFFPQIKEVMNRFQLEEEIRPFTRCLECNSELTVVSKEKVKNRVEEFIYSQYDLFKQCPTCRKIYWKGSHWEDMKKRIKELSAH
jgi:uncharacterized protein with PIN domain